MLMYFAGAAVLAFDFKQHRRPHDAPPVEVSAQRRVLGVAAVYLFYAVPYIFGAVPNHVMSLTVFRWV
jgi:hypothetical protein